MKKRRGTARRHGARTTIPERNNRHPGHGMGQLSRLAWQRLINNTAVSFSTGGREGGGVGGEHRRKATIPKT